jgi:hypothetical protein
MKRLGSLRKILPALAILLALPAWHPASATVGTMPADVATASAANTGPSIAGFRGANFGMTQAQVRGLIETDFRIAPAAINDGENPLQHTQVLTVQVPDLVPGGGTASVSYVFGYTTHRLIEINILWSAQIDPKITPAMLYQNREPAELFRNRRFSGGSQHRQRRDRERHSIVPRDRWDRQRRAADSLRRDGQGPEVRQIDSEPRRADSGLRRQPAASGYFPADKRVFLNAASSSGQRVVVLAL